MEAERRSTMSSLKGQLSNVEGSVKSMKVAVVVGSVLTVACLAAVFGVTVLANEVSKEVKVSNGTLTTKSGDAVMTTSTQITHQTGLNSETLFLENASFKINAVVVNGESTTIVCDDLVAKIENGVTDFTVVAGSVLASFGDEAVEKRAMNCPWCVACLANPICREAVKAGLWWIAERIFADSCKRGSLSGIAAKACAVF